MILSIEKELLIILLFKQIESNFLLTEDEKSEILGTLDEALNSCEQNFIKSNNKYFTRIVDGEAKSFFNPYHSVEYMIFLYYLSHLIYKKGSNTLICDKIYYLNKLLNSVDLFYPIELPVHFGAEHPIGSVLGRAKFGEGFFFYQNCTVGGVVKDGKEIYPTLGKNVELCSNASILGNCIIGDNVIIGAGTLVKNQDIPSDSIVFGESPNIIIKKRK